MGFEIWTISPCAYMTFILLGTRKSDEPYFFRDSVFGFQESGKIIVNNSEILVKYNAVALGKRYDIEML